MWDETAWDYAWAAVMVSTCDFIGWNIKYTLRMKTDDLYNLQHTYTTYDSSDNIEKMSLF